MPKPAVLEIHTSRKLAKAAAKGLKRSRKARRVSVRRWRDLYRVLGVENQDWDENTAPSEYPRRMRYYLGEFKKRKRASKALLEIRKQHKAHYQLLRRGNRWVLATFDGQAYRALGDSVSDTTEALNHEEFANAVSEERAYSARTGDD